ncbi:PorV/PorQ family protein [candidate division KSB1 bacterium]|nr:PorV/PorQ family protein [candidate division KSB1 bacterium]
MMINRFKIAYKFVAVILICHATLAGDAWSQVRAGSAFLKLLPATRTQGMATGLAGGIDEMQTFYANPGATGFIREWQWSANYTKWIADVYNVSLNYGMHFNTFWSDATRVAFGINYQGVKEFDSTLGNQSAVSANDVLAAVSIGNPLTFISDQVALGASVKYLRSELVNFNSNTVLADVGVLYKSRRFRFIENVLDYGYVSAGISLTQIGNPMTFKSVATPMPTTLRGGVSLDLGTHNGVQCKFAVDYLKVKDEIGRISLGSELSWGYLFSVRGGYNFNENLMSKVSLGLSVRLDDVLSPGRVFGRNKAMRLDFAALENNELFDHAYRGSMNHYPIGPEAFEFIYPDYGDTLGFDDRRLSWSPSRDPDLYDDVGYLLLVEKADGVPETDSKLRTLLDRFDDGDKTMARLKEEYSHDLAFVNEYSFMPKDSKTLLEQTVTMLSSGDYYWTVLAHDKDFHYRPIDEKINKFHIVFPDVVVDRIEFEPSLWITESDTQGVITVAISNIGKLNAPHVKVTVVDSLNAMEPIHQEMLHDLYPNTTQYFAFTWLADSQGLHHLHAKAEIIDDRYDFTSEEILDNNSRIEAFYTIPRGVYAIGDTVNAFMKPCRNQDIPINTKVFFDPMSVVMDSGYYDRSHWFYAPLQIMADQVKDKGNVVLSLKGYADAVNEETVEIARERVLAVRNELIALGVRPEQLPEQLMSWEESPTRRVSLNQDVLEERRFVRITALDNETGRELNRELFRPIVFKSVAAPLIPLPIEFTSTIRGVIPVSIGHVHYESDTLRASHQFEYALNDTDKVAWNHRKNGGEQWLGRLVDYQVFMTDTLGREFKTRPRKVKMGTIRVNLPSTVGLAEFNNPIPYPVIPWGSLFEQLKLLLSHSKNLRIRFIGHACGIPPSQVNRLYSRKRAETFKEIFLEELDKRIVKDPELEQILAKQVDHRGTIGRSAEKPFEIMIDQDTFYNDTMNFNTQKYFNTRKVSLVNEKSGNLQPFNFEKNNGNLHLIGDNDSPNGRQLNRRIEIQVYSID